MKVFKFIIVVKSTRFTFIFKVDFLQPATVSSVVLTARDPVNHKQYAKTFKFLYSDDCVLFKDIVDENGVSLVSWILCFFFYYLIFFFSLFFNKLQVSIQ